MMEGDELELEKIGDRKTALFCIVSDTDMTFNFISAMVYTQMFNVLCDRALQNGGALKTHVTCLLDEFANQKIPNFQHLISVIRSREISETLGKETIDLYNTSDTRGSQRSMGVNYQKLGKELMSQDELAVMDGGKCILQVQGVRPFFSDKFDITRHPQYKYLLDSNPKNAFDVAKYLSHRLTVRPDDVFECYEFDSTPSSEETFG